MKNVKLADFRVKKVELADIRAKNRRNWQSIPFKISNVHISARKMSNWQIYTV